MKIKSCHKPVVNFEFNLESVKSNKWIRSKKYQSANYTINKNV